MLVVVYLVVRAWRLLSCRAPFLPRRFPYLAFAPRSRGLAVKRRGVGKACEGPVQDYMPCGGACEPTDCQFGEWAEWAECGDCTGSTHRTREVSQPAVAPGHACSGPLEEVMGCASTDACSACHLPDWADWGHCTATCGSGQQERKRHALVTGPCDAATTELRACPGLPDCAEEPDFCDYSPWAEWSDCSASCDGWYERSRYVSSVPTAAGPSCRRGALKEAKPCGEPCQHSQSAASSKPCTRTVLVMVGQE